MLGNVILENEILSYTSNIQEFDMSKFTCGEYNIIINTDNNIYTQKIILR